MAADTTDERAPLTAEDLDRIRARLLANANLGVDPASPAFLDAVEGSIYLDLEGPQALELDEFYDFADLVARATIPTDAYGEWLDDWAESLGLQRRPDAPAGGVLHFTGTPGTVIDPGVEIETLAVGDADPIAFQVTAGGMIDGTGVADLDATAVVTGSAGNVPAGTVTEPSATIDGVADVTNPLAMTAGADVENDEQLSDRVRDALSGDVGSGTQADYRRWLLGLPGIGFVTVRVAARGGGTVDLYVTDYNNDPVPPALLASTQAWLDPRTGPGEGLGQAPIGHDALVLTPDTFGVAVAATLEHAPGYSLDGAGGTIATRAAVSAAVTAYVNGLDVGAPIIRDQVIRAIVSVPGVVKITDGTLTLNGAADGDLATPAESVPATSGPPVLT